MPKPLRWFTTSRPPRRGDPPDEIYGTRGLQGPDPAGGHGGRLFPSIGSRGADAGALGMVGLTNAPLSYVEKSLDEMRKLTSGVFGANFLVPGLVDDATGKVDPEFAGVVEAAASRARVVDFFYGEPDPALVD